MLKNKISNHIKKKVFYINREDKSPTYFNKVVLYADLGYKFEIDRCIDINQYLDKLNFDSNLQSSIICDIVKEQCFGRIYIDGSNTIFITNTSFEKVLNSIDASLNNLDIVDPIAHSKLVEDTLNFFNEKKIVVMQEGAQGIIYKAGQFIQSYGSTALTVESIMMSRLLGVTGSKVLAGQPLLYITIPTVGGIFFHGASMIFGETILGNSCRTVGNILLLPMKGTEIILNNIVFQPIGKFTGIPILLNMTKAINTGPGLSVEDAKKAINIVRKGKLSPLWRKVSSTYNIWFGK